MRNILSIKQGCKSLFLLYLITFFIGCNTRYPADSFDETHKAMPTDLEEHLKTSVTHLSSTIGERNLYKPNKLNAASDWIEKQFQNIGYRNVKRLPVIIMGSDFSLPSDTVAWNIEAILPGTDPSAESLVIGAHYDSKVAMPGWHDHWPPESCKTGTPGANDNASGLAALLVLASELRKTPHSKTIRFVAFTNEEPPFYQTTAMGSFAYVKMLHETRSGSFRMISLDTLGCYSERQRNKRNRLVSLFGLGDTPNYVAFLGNFHSEAWVNQSAKAFSLHSSVELRTLVLPEISNKVAWSDDWSFWQFNYPAFTITDTAFLRHDDYHEIDDTAQKLDYPIFAKVVWAIKNMIEVFVK
jgi:Peptidase family M28